MRPERKREKEREREREREERIEMPRRRQSFFLEAFFIRKPCRRSSQERKERHLPPALLTLDSAWCRVSLLSVV